MNSLLQSKNILLQQAFASMKSLMLKNAILQPYNTLAAD